MHPLDRRFACGVSGQRDIAGEVFDLRSGRPLHTEMLIDALHDFDDGQSLRQFA